MDQSLYQRLDLLLAAGQINPTIKEAVVGFGLTVEKKFQLRITEENAAMLITHLAMALARIFRGEVVEGLPEEALAELRNERAYQEVPSLYLELEKKLALSIPEAEKNYITLHTCVLVANCLNKNE